MVTLLPDLGRFARFLTKHRDRSEDLVQDTIVRALTAEHLFTPGTNLRSWLFRIMRNAWLNSKRPSANNELPTDPHSLRFEILAPDARDAIDDLSAISAFLPSVPDKYTAPLMMHVMDGMEYCDIAAKLDIPPGTVRSRINRARQSIAHHMAAA